MHLILIGSSSVTVMPSTIQTRTGTAYSTSHSNMQPSSNAIAKQSSVSTAAIDTSPLSLLDMPYEILDKIFSYAGFKQVAQMRLVSWTPHTQAFDSTNCPINLKFEILICFDCATCVGIIADESSVHHHIEFDLLQITNTHDETI